MKSDVFIFQSFMHSEKSAATVKTYRQWVSKLCQYAGKPHPLDVSVDDVQRYYLYLHDDREYSRPSLEIVRAALKYYYCVLLAEEVPEGMRCTQEVTEGVRKLFSGRRSHAKRLPEIITNAEMADFLRLLPDTNAGVIIRRLYTTGQTIKMILAEIAPLRVSVGHLQQVCSRTARAAGIAHGFGLRGVRAAGIVRRIQNRETDLELKAIMEDAGITYQQFRLYRQAAGHPIRQKTPPPS